MTTKAELQEQLDDALAEIKQRTTECENWEESCNKLEGEQAAIRENFNERLDKLYEAIDYLLEALRGNSKAHALVAIDRMEATICDTCDEEQS